MANRGRGWMAGDMFDGEYDSQSIVDIKARLDALETPTVPGGTTTLTGTPQAATPYAIAFRVDVDALVYVTVRLTSLATTLRRFWLYHRIVKNDGITYGKPFIQRVVPTAVNIASNSIEVELKKGLKPNRRYDLVLIEAKLTDDGTNDGGSRDTNPNPYIEATGPNGAGGGSVQLATFNTGAAQTDRQAFNDALNTKLNWGQADWGDTNGAGSHTNHYLARWRYGFALPTVGWNIDASIGDQTISTATNYWSSAQHVHPNGATVPAGVLVMQIGGPSGLTADPCVKLHHDPYDAGEPVEVQFSIFISLARGGIEPTFIEVQIEDGSSGAVMAVTGLSPTGLNVPANTWKTVRCQSTTVRADYVQTPGAGQVCRFHMSSGTGGGFLMIDKVLVSQMPGGYSKNPRDAEVSADNPTVARTGATRGPLGYGNQGGNTPSGGQMLRDVTD